MKVPQEVFRLTNFSFLVFSEYLVYVKTMLGSGGTGSGYSNDVSPFLHGKCLWLLCRYADASADIYDRQTLREILDCVANNLSGTKPMTVQVSAMRALFELCQGLKTASDEQRAMVIEKLPRFINFITDIVTRAKNNILSELLLTIVAVTSVRVAALLEYSQYPFSLICSFACSPTFSLIRLSRPIIMPESFRSQLRFSSSFMKIRSYLSRCKTSCMCSPKMSFASVRCKRNWCRRWWVFFSWN